MYFPYLRGKQFEMLALRELPAHVVSSPQFRPILEPVRRGQSENTAQLVANGLRLIIVENPDKGDFRANSTPVRALLSGDLNDDRVTVGYIIRPGMRQQDIDSFLRRNAGRRVAFVHFSAFTDPAWLLARQTAHGSADYNVFLADRSGRAYRDTFPAQSRVLLTDTFVRRHRNENYPPNEFFSDMHIRFRGEGLAGFGDFSIIGDHYAETGGAALAVAIHLVSREGNNELWVRHFLSDRTTGRGVDTAGKFMEALRKTVRFIESGENALRTEACDEFADLHGRRHFPGLGFIKKVSIKHHLELVSDIMRLQA